MSESDLLEFQNEEELQKYLEKLSGDADDVELEANLPQRTATRSKILQCKQESPDNQSGVATRRAAARGQLKQSSSELRAFKKAVAIGVATRHKVKHSQASTSKREQKSIEDKLDFEMNHLNSLNNTDVLKASPYELNEEQLKDIKQDQSDVDIYEYDELYTETPNDEEVPHQFIGKIVENKSEQSTAPQFNCSECKFSTKKHFLLTRHMNCHAHQSRFSCSLCDKQFRSNSTLQNHLNVHMGNKPHKCQDCESSFTTTGELMRHRKYRHTREKPYKCTECDYASVELSKLRRHMRSHTGERPYQCPHCTYASADTFKLKRHLRIHTGEKPYECNICQARFTQQNTLKAHLLIHSTTDKPMFQCPHCPATCGRKPDLRNHIRKMHMADEPIPCKQCGKKLPDRYSYKLHKKTHIGEKCFQCELCPYASTSMNILMSHMYTHTNEKPFQCESCPANFRQKQLLMRHYNIHHKESYVPPAPLEKSHKCPHCQRVFAHKGNLIRHMEVHDAEAKPVLSTAISTTNIKTENDLHFTILESIDENHIADFASEPILIDSTTLQTVMKTEVNTSQDYANSAIADNNDNEVESDSEHYMYMEVFDAEEDLNDDEGCTIVQSKE